MARDALEWDFCELFAVEIPQPATHSPKVAVFLLAVVLIALVSTSERTVGIHSRIVG